jgi:hypothetical protein
MLFQEFNVGLWSTLPMWYLRPLLAVILSDDIIQKLSFVFDLAFCKYSRNHPHCYKLLSMLLRKKPSKDICLEDQVLFVDVVPNYQRRVADSISYRPFPFRGQISFPNDSGIIPNVATDILPFIYPLHKFGSVPEYVRQAPRPGQEHYEQIIADKQGRFWDGVVWDGPLESR